ncbi:MAG: GNAT family N-acetyltransferase [Gammaproteobacteria bacterium]|nr:GNAT family N-acetyltransferase [Gammaproteobacteria bacterium]
MTLDGAAARHPAAVPQQASVAVADSLRIIRGSPAEAWRLAGQIAEFGGEAETHGLEIYRRRLAGSSALVLIATVGDRPVGFKAGYDRFQDGSWYSWMGGVLEPWRGQGIAQRLLEAQEAWVARQGYRLLYVKTRNQHKRMIAFLAVNGYDILRLEEKSTPEESRILFGKVMPAV